MRAFRINEINNKELAECHFNNNDYIYAKILEFQKHNNLSVEDFIIGGSAAMSYLDLLILPQVRDIDIFMIKDIEVERVPGVDVVQYKMIQSQWNYSTVYKDGFYFLSTWELLKGAGIIAIKKLKRSDFVYIKLLLEQLNITLEDFKTRFFNELETTCLPAGNTVVIDYIKTNFSVLESWLNPKPLPDFILKDKEKGIRVGTIIKEENNGSNQTD